jgi:hypothetical protein
MEKKEVYERPVLVKHALLRDITATSSGQQREPIGFGFRWLIRFGRSGVFRHDG